MAKKGSDTEQVAAFIKQLEPDTGIIIETIREAILGVDPTIGERIKWNNPSFYYTGEMAPFDPKEYKREIAVFNLFKGRIMLVLPGGASLNNDAGLLEGDFRDGRRTIVFSDLADVKSKMKDLKKLIQNWLQLVEKL
jgi:hypothetical protein